ncbi:MAG: FAD-dependent oxidoreductase [bacterium]|nr:FAD-dependent oxidoreductase [bacterium]
MIVILGGGLSGLTAGYVLTQAGRPATVIEKETTVGGLARTMSYKDHRFDLGGHRFLTNDRKINQLVQELLGEDLLTVPRKSRIYFGDRSVDYPLTPANAVFGLGVAVTVRILLDYGKEKAVALVKPRTKTSLEDWVVAQFGRTMFDLYFKDYSEKVWGIGCNAIDMDWIAQRIDGLSLSQVIKTAFSKVRGREVKTLTDTFHYPRWGIGQLADKLGEAIGKTNRVMTGTAVTRIHHRSHRITAVEAEEGCRHHVIEGDDYVTSIPMTRLLDFLSPRPPEAVLEAASRLAYRDLVTVTVLADRERVTDLTWLYLPQKEVPFGRIHEPTNWSPNMAPKGKTHLVAEYFCNWGDAVWSAGDDQLESLTVEHLERLGLIRRRDVTGSCVTRIRHAYPLFKIGYREEVRTIANYLARLENLYVVGRSGMFRYLNMDPAMGSGLEAAERLLRRPDASRISKHPGPIQAPIPEAVSP